MTPPKKTRKNRYILLGVALLVMGPIQNAKACGGIGFTCLFASAYCYLIDSSCCPDCINTDLSGETQTATQLEGTFQNLAAMVSQGIQLKQQLANDFVILKGLGQNLPSIAQIANEFAFNQGLTYIPANTTASEEMNNLANLYENNQSSTNFTNAPTGAYQTMYADLNNYSVQTIEFASQTSQSNTADMNALQQLATAVGTSTTLAGDIQANSEIKAQLIDLQELHTTLLAQYLGLEARDIAARQQTDLTPMTLPNDN